MRLKYISLCNGIFFFFNLKMFSLPKNAQVKSRALEESAVFEDAEKPGNSVEEKPLGGEEEKLAAGTCFGFCLEGSAVLSSLSAGGNTSPFRFYFGFGFILTILIKPCKTHPEEVKIHPKGGVPLLGRFPME